MARYLGSFKLADGTVAIAALSLLLGLLIYVIRAATDMIRDRAPHPRSSDAAAPQAQLGSRHADPAAADGEKTRRAG
jgi:Na+-transporting methylmalonyl-CoA/oxaloacetate decarboxylase gamma subunit